MTCYLCDATCDLAFVGDVPQCRRCRGAATYATIAALAEPKPLPFTLTPPALHWPMPSFYGSQPISWGPGGYQFGQPWANQDAYFIVPATTNNT